MFSIGIDLGTTNCCISAFTNGRLEVIENEAGVRTTPSYIYFGENETLYGQGALKKYPYHPQRTIYDVKRFLGKKCNDPSLESYKKKWAFKLEDVKGKVKVLANGQHFDPEELSGMLLGILKERAETRLLHKVTRAVITVPTYFNIVQRQATIDAGKLAGFDEVKLLTEPTAGALAYNTGVYYIHAPKPKTIFVFDFGGGTFDVSVVEMETGSVKVLAIDGDVNLGGNDVTTNLLNYMSPKIPKMEEHVTYINNAANDVNDKQYITSLRNYMRFFAQCEDWKKELSDTLEVECEFEGVEVRLSRGTLEEINESLFARMMQIVKKCLDKINMGPEKIDEVLLIGGSTKIPKLRQKLKEIFGSRLCQAVNADEAVSIGAAVIASKWDEREEFSDFNFVDLCPYNLGVEYSSHKCTKNDHFMCILIPEHTQLPAKFTKAFCNSRDMVLEINFRIYSGYDKYCTLNNTFIGNVEVSGFTPGPANSVEVDVTFIYDENGTLQVEAVERTTAKPYRLTIKLDVGNRIPESRSS